MQLIGRVFVLAVCVLSAYSFPHIANNYIGSNEAIYELITSHVRAALLDTRALSPAEIVCQSLYDNSTTTIKNNLYNQTNVCFENANKTSVANDAAANVTVNSIKNDLLAVQRQLANCTNLNDTSLFLNCTTATYDSNLELLDRANSNSYLAVAQLRVNQTQVEYTRSACISVAVSGAKHNLTTATNEFNTCVENISKHRGANALWTGN